MPKFKNSNATYWVIFKHCKMYCTHLIATNLSRKWYTCQNDSFFCRTWIEMERRYMDHNNGHPGKSWHWTCIRPWFFPSRKSMHGSSGSLANHFVLHTLCYCVILHLFCTIWLWGHRRDLFLEDNGHSSCFRLFVFTLIVQINYVGHVRFGWVARPYYWIHSVGFGLLYDDCRGMRLFKLFSNSVCMYYFFL